MYLHIFMFSSSLKQTCICCSSLPSLPSVLSSPPYSPSIFLCQQMALDVQKAREQATALEQQQQQVRCCRSYRHAASHACSRSGLQIFVRICQGLHDRTRSRTKPDSVAISRVLTGSFKMVTTLTAASCKSFCKNVMMLSLYLARACLSEGSQSCKIYRIV